MRAPAASRALLAAALVVATALFLAPLPAAPGGAPAVPHLDKVGHVLVLAALALLARRAFPRRAPAALWAALVAYAAAIEGVQALLPWRSAEALDLLADALGALAALVPARPRAQP